VVAIHTVGKLTAIISAWMMAVWLSMSGFSQAKPPAQSAFVNTLMPEPAHLEVGNGRFPISSELRVTTDHFRDERLDRAIARMQARLAALTSAPLDDRSAAATNSEPSLVVSIESAGELVQSVDEDESYSLDVTPLGIHLQSRTDVGAIRGLETLLQLVQSDGTGYFLPAISIQDEPRFPWRGLMLDCSRHFEPVDEVERTLDGMAAVKLNVFHWHLTDDQGFRIESRIFPKLTGMGSDGLYYTQEQAKEIVAYARERGIRVVPEFDMPGHATSWMVGYPELASAPGPFAIERHFGIFDPVMDPTRERTYAFLDKFIAEMATIFPDSYMHIGGDENNGVEWKHNPRIQRFMQVHHFKSTADLQSYFNARIFAILKKHGKRMVGWDEIMTPALSKDVVVQSWRGFGSLAQGAKQGYSGILSAGYYLGHMDSTAAYYQVDPLPADSDLTPEQSARLLGGEVCSWGEYVDARTLDSRVWPITAAIAERFWSPRSVDDTNDMYRRVETESLRLEISGLTHLTHEGASLRALAGTDQIGSLQVLADVLEPVTFAVRGPWSEKHGVTLLEPLNHLVDALPPDPPFRRSFEKLVSTYLQDPAIHPDEKAKLTAMFHAWTTAPPEILQLMSTAPRLAEARPRALELSKLGIMGLQAVSNLSDHSPAPAGWKQQQLAILDEAEKPEALVRFTVISPLRKLVLSAHER
jgi:hexosaminidase